MNRKSCKPQFIVQCGGGKWVYGVERGVSHTCTVAAFSFADDELALGVKCKDAHTDCDLHDRLGALARDTIGTSEKASGIC